MKNVIAFVAAGVIMLGCVLLPPAFSRMSDKLLVDNVVTIENEYAVSGYSYQLSLEERLSLFMASKSSATIISQYNEITDHAEVIASLALIEPEIDELKELGVFPMWIDPDFSGRSSYLGIITCSDLYDPYTGTVYREMTTGGFNGETCFFRQDVQSGKIIEFWVSGGADIISYTDDAGALLQANHTNAEDIARSWMEYLGLEDYTIYTDQYVYDILFETSVVLSLSYGSYVINLYTEGYVYAPYELDRSEVYAFAMEIQASGESISIETTNPGPSEKT